MVVAPAQECRANQRIVSSADINQSPSVAQPRLQTWLSPLLDHDLVLVIGVADEIVYSQAGRTLSDGRLIKEATSRAPFHR